MRPLKGTLSPRAEAGRIIGATTRGHHARATTEKATDEARRDGARARGPSRLLGPVGGGVPRHPGATGGEEAAQASANEGDGAPDVAAEEVETTVTESGLSVTGPTEFLETEAYAYLEEQIAELEERDVTLGIVVRDPESGYELAYNADEALYPASAIKAAYCAMVCEEFGGAGELAGALEDCLVNSSNEAYTALREAFGLEAFGAWLEEVGAEGASVQALEYGYPDISANELAAVWEET